MDVPSGLGRTGERSENVPRAIPIQAIHPFARQGRGWRWQSQQLMQSPNEAPGHNRSIAGDCASVHPYLGRDFLRPGARRPLPGELDRRRGGEKLSIDK